MVSCQAAVLVLVGEEVVYSRTPSRDRVGQLLLVEMELVLIARSLPRRSVSPS